MARRNLTFRTFKLLLALCASVATASCSDDHEDGHGHDGDIPAECQAIIDACHEKDPGEEGNPLTACHTVGHAGVREDCANIESIVPNCPQICIDAPPPSADAG